jgi:hypothetical protein
LSPSSSQWFVALIVAARSLRSLPSDAASPLVVAPVVIVALVFTACHRACSSLLLSRLFVHSSSLQSLVALVAAACSLRLLVVVIFSVVSGGGNDGVTCAM